jgi:phthalate 4,5-dioxygenase oxygenase subunit
MSQNHRCDAPAINPTQKSSLFEVPLKSYPLIECGGVLWAYMGPEEQQPPHPDWEFIAVPERQCFVSKRVQESNWLQAMEGGIDSSHVSFLHRGDLNSDPMFKGARGIKYLLADSQPVFEVVRAPAAFTSGRAATPSTIAITGALPNG